MDVLPVILAVISVVFSSDKSVPSTIQPIAPLLALQVKVAVDPSVVLIDMGVLIKSEIQMNKIDMPIQLLVLCSSLGSHVAYPIDMVPGLLYYEDIIKLPTWLSHGSWVPDTVALFQYMILCRQ